MKTSRRIIVLLAWTSLLLGLLGPHASAAKPAGKHVQSADLAIGITDSPDPVAFEGVVKYTVTVSNAGPSSASPVLDISVSGGSIESWSFAGGSCTPSGSQLKCALSSLGSGATTSGTVSVRSTAGAYVTGVSLSGTVSSSKQDPNTTNNKTNESTKVMDPIAVFGNPVNGCATAPTDFPLPPVPPLIPNPLRECTFVSTGAAPAVIGAHVSSPADVLCHLWPIFLACPTWMDVSVSDPSGTVLASCTVPYGTGYCTSSAPEPIPAGIVLTCRISELVIGRDWHDANAGACTG